MNQKIQLSQKERIVYWACVIAFILCWSPFNILGYAAPFVFIFLTVFIGLQWEFGLRIMYLFVFWILQIFFYLLINDDFQIFNAFISIITWIGIITIIIYPSDTQIRYNLLYKRLLFVMWLVLLVESSLGFVQGIYGFTSAGTFDGSMGDFVEGTLHPSLEPEYSFSNPIFSTNISLLLLLLTPDITKSFSKKKLTVYILGIVVLVMASTGHVILAFLVSVLLSFSIILTWGLLKRASFVKELSRWFSIIAVAVVAVFALLYLMQPRNVSAISSWLRFSDTPRLRLIAVLTQTIPDRYWFAPFIGFGPGQFASRAGMISTGLYFGGQWHNAPASNTTYVQRRFLIPLKRWQIYTPAFGRSSNAAPHSSWLALFSEYGMLGIFFALFIILMIIISIFQIVPTSPIETGFILSMVFLISLIGWQELYWEVPQAWFSALIIAKILFFKVKQQNIMVADEPVLKY